MLLAGEDLAGKKFAGDEPEGGPGVREGHEAARDLAEFAEDRFAVAGDRLVADLPGRGLEFGVAGDELGCFVGEFLDHVLGDAERAVRVLGDAALRTSRGPGRRCFRGWAGRRPGGCSSRPSRSCSTGLVSTSMETGDPFGISTPSGATTAGVAAPHATRTASAS